MPIIPAGSYAFDQRHARIIGYPPNFVEIVLSVIGRKKVFRDRASSIIIKNNGQLS